MNKAIIADSIEVYGQRVQSVVCMEECCELAQAISKELRGKSDKTHLAEEMADVLICIEMLKQMYNIKDKTIDNWIKAKQQRTTKRMKEYIVLKAGGEA